MPKTNKGDVAAQRKRYKLRYPEKVKAEKARYRKAHPEKIKEEKRQYALLHPDRIQKYTKQYNTKLRSEIIEYYSNGFFRCAICEDNHIEFLEIVKTGPSDNYDCSNFSQFNKMQWLKNNNFPDGYIILCSNCNTKRIKVAARVIGTDGTYEQKKCYRKLMRMKQDVFSHYSEDGKIKCSCPGCNVDDIDMLCVDHKNNDGNEHRKTLGVKQIKYGWIKKNNYPDYLRVLCHNCNQSLGKYGYCPHEKTNLPMVI